MKKVHHFLKSHLMKLAICVLLIITTSQSVTAFAAYGVYTTQVTVDDINWQIVAGVVWEEVDGSAKEVWRIGKDNLETLAANGGDPGVGATLLDGLNVAAENEGYKDDSASSSLVMTYPGTPRKGIILKKDSNRKDQTRANTVKDILLYDLNDAYSFVYEGKKPDGIESYKKNMVALLKAVSSAVSGSGGSITTGHTYSFRLATTSDINKVDNKTMLAEDYVVISNGEEEEIFAYRIPKGYVGEPTWDAVNNTYTSAKRTYDSSLDYGLSSSDDATYITWGEFAYEAFASYCLNEELAVTNENVYAGEPNALENILVGVVSNFVNDITSRLGLWDIDELVLNSGVRGSSGYVGGVFPASWENIIWTFFYVVEILSLIILSFAILAGIYKRAMSTVNPVVRASFMEQVKNIFIAIFVLIMLPIIFRLLLSTSATLTEISASALGEETAVEKLRVLSNSSGTLAGIVMQLVYLCSLIYFNFFYFIRSIFVAVIIALSPALVMAYAIGDNWKNTTLKFIKITVATIFIQPIQAFCLTMILLLPMEGRGFQSIIAIYALIPLTNMVKDIVLDGPSGLHVAAKGGGDNTVRHMKRAGFAAAAGVGAAVGTTAGAIAGVVSGSGSGESGKQSSPPTKAEEEGKKDQQKQEENPDKNNTTGGTVNTSDASGSGSQATGSSEEGTWKSFFKTAGRGLSRGARVVAGAAIAGTGETLNAMGFRNGLQQMGRGAIAGAITRTPQKESPSNEVVDQKKDYENEVLPPNATTTGTENEGGIQSPPNGAEEAPVDVLPLTPAEIGHNIINGEMPADALAELEQTDLRVDGMRVNSDESEFKANEKTMSSVGISISKPKKSAESGSGKPTWDRTHNRTVTYSAGQLSQVDQANLAAAEQVFRSGDAEKIKALQDSGIQNVSAEYDIVDGKMKTSVYKVDVNDTKKFRENYDIDLNGTWDGGKTHGMITKSGSFVPKVINNEKVKIPITQKVKDAPQNPNIVDPSQEEGGDYPENFADQQA